MWLAGVPGPTGQGAEQLPSPSPAVNHGKRWPLCLPGEQPLSFCSRGGLGALSVSLMSLLVLIRTCSLFSGFLQKLSLTQAAER